MLYNRLLCQFIPFYNVDLSIIYCKENHGLADVQMCPCDSLQVSSPRALKQDDLYNSQRQTQMINPDRFYGQVDTSPQRR